MLSGSATKGHIVPTCAKPPSLKRDPIPRRCHFRAKGDFCLVIRSTETPVAVRHPRSVFVASYNSPPRAKFHPPLSPSNSRNSRSIVSTPLTPRVFDTDFHQRRLRFSSGDTKSRCWAIKHTISTMAPLIEQMAALEKRDPCVHWK